MGATSITLATRLLYLSVGLLSVLSLPLQAFAQSVPSFPGAKGFGSSATGGRGGGVYRVTTTQDGTNIPGETTLRDCVEDTRSMGARTCVFAIGGTISISSALEITDGNITIAGESAPGDGIAIKGTGTSKAVLSITDTENIILRYLRLRGGPTDDKAGVLEVEGSRKIMVDHLSISWSVDENLALINSQDITIQNSIVAEPLNCSVHYEGGCHSKNFFGYYRIASNSSDSSLDDSFQNISVYNNVLAHAADRNPRFRREETSQLKDKNIDVVNNVIYNFGAGSSIESHFVNIVGNYYKTGPDSDQGKSAISAKGENMYIAQNVGLPTSIIRTSGDRSTPHSFLTPFSTSETAYQQALTLAGASFPKRDAVDTRILYEVEHGTGKIIDAPSQKLCIGKCPSSNKYLTVQDYAQAGVTPQLDSDGYPVLATGTAPLDSDTDGIPDDWEHAHNLNPNNPSDGALQQDGYSNLEHYLHERIAGDVILPSVTPTPPTTPTPPANTPTAPETSPTTCLLKGDFDNNCTVNIIDFGIFIVSFESKKGETLYSEDTDINQDNVVDILDFAVMIQNFST